jgi:CRP/FNR family cyclic AMP-dependent transcriptional regulator
MVKRLTIMVTQGEFLSSIPYFTGLDESGLGSVRPYVYEKKAGRGEMLLTEGGKADALYFVAEGAVKVFKTSADGKEQILRILRPGESFNDVAVLNGGTSLVSAAAMGPVVLYAIEKSDLEKVMREHPQIAFNVINVLSRRVVELISLVEDLSFRHVTGRVAKMLLEYAGDRTGERPRLTQQEMAAIIGTAREMVGRALKGLESDGAIRMERNRIVITNRKALQETAGVP